MKDDKKENSLLKDATADWQSMLVTGLIARHIAKKGDERSKREVEASRRAEEASRRAEEASRRAEESIKRESSRMAERERELRERELRFQKQLAEQQEEKWLASPEYAERQEQKRREEEQRRKAAEKWLASSEYAEQQEQKRREEEEKIQQAKALARKTKKGKNCAIAALCCDLFIPVAGLFISAVLAHIALKALKGTNAKGCRVLAICILVFFYGLIGCACASVLIERL